MNEGTAPLLAMENVSIEFETAAGTFSAVRDFNLTLHRGRKLAIVGESGSGKSTVAASINGLLAENGRVASGRILFDNRDISVLGEADLRELRGAQIGRVPQDPMTNLNPLKRIGDQLCEALEVHGRMRGKAARDAALELMAMIGLHDPERCFRQYPHEMSGGMRQRVLIAIGLACGPQLLIADEPTSALDVTVQKVILDELDRMTGKLGTALILVTHDLLMAAERADEILVMYRGDVVESGPAAEILGRPGHEYTKRLLEAAPTLRSEKLAPGLPARAGGNSETAPGRDLVEFINVRKVYSGRRKWFGKGKPFVAVKNSSFTIPRGQTVAVVGESGSGKSTTARLLLKLEEPTSGDIIFDGAQINHLSTGQLKDFRKRVQPVFQNPYGSLDMRYTVRESIEEPLLLHGYGDAVDRRTRVDELLEQVALPLSVAEKRPDQISGGQSQRVAIARALALSPELVVLDEAVSALDVLVQAQILELLCQLQVDLGLSYLFISHDLAVVRMISHQVHVMQAGEIVESGTPDEIFNCPKSTYTRQLIASIPGGTWQH
ncbi:dipeptide ABC transporter ATP-binding protein [Oricola thermophila]|uniref:ABC transporter ATP-binding protein n=1 Tax=Oricola thermophila TaxID=2742145 RepID=A0A6N1VIE1_9HYPH|nr:ABC transporter ATP-binding protein [Oricola thermophila]QKV19122.1 ABC transporter ATP-binding protein [Oricola thermophila]